MAFRKLIGHKAESTTYKYDIPSRKAVDGLSSKPALPITSIQGKESSFGTNPVVKTFYEAKDSRSRPNWVETPPKQLNKKVSNAYDRVAIKMYKVEDPDLPTMSGRTPMKIRNIEIQSPIIIAALKDILEDEGTWLEVHEIANFHEPFTPLYLSYERIFDLYNQASSDSVLKEHLYLLTQIMIELFSGMMIQLKHLRESQLISFKLAWTYFPKGSIIYCGAGDCDRLLQVSNAYYVGQTALDISCQEIVFDGTTFNWKSTKLTIPAFTGNVPITSLPHYPLMFHPNVGLLKAKLIERGKKVLDYQDLTYCEYSGVAKSDSSGSRKHHVSGRILIDFHGYAKYFLGLKRSENSFDHAIVHEKQDNDLAKTPAAYVRPLDIKEQQENKAAMLARNQDLMFVSPMLSGFSLNDKIWLQFYIDDIKPVAWNDEAYDHLVYPEEQKDLVLTFVENHKRMKAGFDDVIVGKGEGLIVLLSGPPGTGKTLLAEAVADKTQRPLYHLQAEELGITASSLGEKIKKVFEMATEWNAVILLDEADVFMAKRSPSDIRRNELVSIFLRELEYFQGIIFLTTNLYETIDDAFRSRVNVHLLFSHLSFSSRLKLWQNFLARLPPHEPPHSLADTDVERIASWDLNGREIKNACKTVRTWCLCKGYRLELVRVESAIQVTAPQARWVGE